jgi:hypothetical protein
MELILDLILDSNRATQKFYTPETIDLYARRHFLSYWNMFAKHHPEVFQ